jgi:hypothetical protein
MTDHADQEHEEQQEQFDLSQWDEEYENAPVEERDFENVPDGKYQCVIDRVELTTSKTSDKPMLKWALKIIAPNHVGRLLWRNNMIASPDNIKWLKNDLHTCGLTIKKLSELPENLEKLLDVKVEVTVRTRGENQNIYFNKLIDSGRQDTGDSPNLDREMDEQAQEIFR